MEWLLLNDNLESPRPRERVRAAAWGYISKNFDNRQSAGMSLLHELAHQYYILADPEKYGAIVEAIFNDESLTANQKYNKFYKFLDEMKVEVGDYDTYSDRWIIQNVEDV